MSGALGLTVEARGAGPGHDFGVVEVRVIDDFFEVECDFFEI